MSEQKYQVGQLVYYNGSYLAHLCVVTAVSDDVISIAYKSTFDYWHKEDIGKDSFHRYQPITKDGKYVFAKKNWLGKYKIEI